MTSTDRPAAVAWLLLATVCVAAAAPQAPVDVSVSRPTGSISGVVVTDDTVGRPIARAVVTLRSAELQPGLQLVTDEAGRFAFAALPPGSFILTASKAPYLSLSYGQATAGRGSGLPISLEAGGKIVDVRIALPPGSVISGRVVDDGGKPVDNAPIRVLQYRTVNGERTLSSVDGNWPNTDSRGTYRAYGLPAGEYIVCAYPAGDYLAIPQDCRAGGGGDGLREISPAELRWARQQIQSAGPGAGGSGAGGAPVGPPPHGPTTAYGPVFYPAAADATTAIPITLSRGEERTGVDLVMSRYAAARIAATIIGVDGQPASGAMLRFSDGFGTSGRTTPDGRFSQSDLRPGQYTLSARLGDAAASMDISVNGRDITDLVLRLQPGGVTTVAISGRTVFDRTTLTPPASLTGVRVSLVAVKPTGLLTTLANADGTFTLSGIEPGRYRMQISLAGQPPTGPVWYVKSAMVNGQDASDAFVDLAPGQTLSDVVVTFTDHPSELSGRLQDGSGRPAAGYYVVVFSTDKSFWRQGARRLPAPARAATDGTYRFSNLPAGTYYLAALTEVNQADLNDDAFLGQLTASALTISLAEGEKKTQNLTIGTAR